MTEEPVYEYTRGVGWAVVPPGPTKLSHVVGAFRITVIDRLPLAGERGWDIMSDDSWVPDDATRELQAQGLWKPSIEVLRQLYCFQSGAGWISQEDCVNIHGRYYVTIEREVV